MPAIELTPSSTFLVTSLSTISGDAPGYSVMMTTTGKSMFGNWSTCSRWYEKMPSTTSASISIVAKTGFFRLTRVNHMAAARSGGAARRSADGLRQLHGRAFAQRPDGAGDDQRAVVDAAHRHHGLAVDHAALA